MQLYTAMYGERYGFYEFFEAQNDEEAMKRASEFMQTEEFQRQCAEHRKAILARTGLRNESIDFHFYQLLEGEIFGKSSNRVVWDCYNGMLRHN